MMTLALCALIFATIGFCAAVYAAVQVEAMKRSTHQVAYVDPWKEELAALQKDLGTQEFETFSERRKEKIQEQNKKALDDAETFTDEDLEE
jgi:uncharacterized protein YigE (DUF2233 family)